ncbi:hypothetical protein Taro_027062 [Colocasia esculenta]|uniref:Uncharacterized protein n=1 Tax=Colocasia esculenta TaxID=4460 RepID=A0A843VDJ3_COLES|nr:hypothetical protein [Colocasia esculenta]
MAASGVSGSVGGYGAEFLTVEQQERFTSVKIKVCGNKAVDIADLQKNGMGTNISCKCSVDTTIHGVDTMVQNKGRNVKKSSPSVDTSPGQVDTRVRFQRNKTTGFHLRSTLNQTVDTTSSQVDTRDLSQGIDLPVWDSVSTHLMGRSTHSGISVT